jgi:nucleotide-binding universal stress UspA family protein
MRRRIVVGVDGSKESVAALRWAVEEARLREATLEAVTAWSLPRPVYIGAPEMVLPDELASDLEREAKDSQRWAMAEVVPEGGVPVDSRVVEGHAAAVLLQASEGADMLVVGSRGLGGFRELLLGSVSHQCAQHATCPG